MTLPNKRAINFVGFLACVAMMAYALYAQHVLGLEPCPLCIFQRIAVIALGTLFLAAALHNPGKTGGIVYAVLLDLVKLAGLIVAGRHIWLQHLPADKVPSCGPGLGYMLDNFPLADTLKKVFSGSGECAAADWHFVGLSMPEWVFIALLVIGGVGVWNNIRARR